MKGDTMNRKRFYCISLVLVLLLTISSLPILAGNVHAKKVTIKAISAWPTNEVSVADDYLVFIKKANEQLKAKHPGEAEIVYIGGPEVIPTKNQAESLRQGVVHMYFGSDAYYAGIAPGANCSRLSQLYAWEEEERGADAIFNEIHQKKLNSYYLGRLASEFGFQLYLNKPVEKPEDIKGLRIRVSPIYLEFMNALGAAPLDTSPGDIYQALERGVVDGFIWPFFTIRTWGWHEVSKYVVGPQFYKVCHAILINLDVWNQLSKPVQQTLQEVLRKEAREAAERDAKKVAEEKELLKKAGMQFITFTEADTKRYLDMAYESAWEGMIKKSPEYAPKLRKILSK
jgi:TRAP-type C4-dicarboxylate transport system substrate-binding protein